MRIDTIIKDYIKSNNELTNWMQYIEEAQVTLGNGYISF